MLAVILLEGCWCYSYITGYYGEISKTAVEDFQNINGIEATGIADYNTLAVMFSEKALYA